MLFVCFQTWVRGSNFFSENAKMRIKGFHDAK
jgi:hypothetical protein